MMRSLYSGISGLRNHQTRMDVIANNISNVNTAGYVASRVVFKDVFSQTSRYATGASTSTGGTNPVQIGLGMSLATIDMLHGSGGAFARSDRELDFAISGEGFFIVDVNGSLKYTRAGNFYLDNESNLVNGDGHFVMGVMLDDPDDGGGNGYDGSDIRTTYAPIAGTPIDPEDYQDPADLVPINLADYHDIVIDGNGIISGVNADGVKCALGYLVLGTFANTNGLEKIGNSLYQQSNNSGAATFYVAKSGSAGEIMQGGLEMSNVDLASEFTDMIVTQRGFQANSRIITTSDSILEELVNLKR